MTRTRIILAVIALVVAVSPSQAASPKSKGYPFQLSPDKAIGVVEKLEKISGKKVALTDDERKLFADARDGKLDTMSFGESCLIASGVTDAAKRKVYLTKLDTIETDARKAITGAKTPTEKAEKLLKFLHDGPMKAGYESKQTDLHTILDTGRFNCVSSAVLFNVIGRRLDLDLVAVEVPQHVFSLLRDGDQKIDVETTSPRGVNPNGLKTPKGKAPTDRYKGQRREVGELGLASVIAYNHSVTMIEEKRFHEAVMMSFRALSLDPTNPGAAQNTLAGFVQWGVELENSGKYEEALTVAATGLEVSPKESIIKNNTMAVYDSWANSYMKKNDWAGAIVVYEKALAKMPGDSHMKHNLAYCKQELTRK
jgi:tetratricopeptide (TPR) repeat protein